jgi:hypothetical protein
LITLVVQGLTFPLVIRAVNYKDPDHTMPEKEQLSTIHRQLIDAALKKLSDRYAKESVENELVANLKNRMEKELYLHSEREGNMEVRHSEWKQTSEYHKIFTDLIKTQRTELMKIRDKHKFDDEVIRRIEMLIDLEEERLSHQYQE